MKDRNLDKDEIIINTHSFFKYAPWHNHLKIELIDAGDQEHTLAEATVALTGVPLDKFAERSLMFRNQAFLDNAQSYMHSLTHIKASFFLESTRWGNQNELYRSLMTIQKKLPDRIDIFNNQENEDISENFEKLVNQEQVDLGKFLSEEKVYEIINETYNFVESGNTGNLTLA